MDTAQKHVAWDFEEDSITPYYHVYGITDKGEDVLGGSLTFEVEESPEHDELIRQLVAILNALIR